MRIDRKRFPRSANGSLAFIRPRAASAPSPEATKAIKATHTTQAGSREIPAGRGRPNIVQWLSLGASLLALAVGLLDFTLLIGALPMPVPGLRAAGQPALKDTATYAFEFDNDGWLTRGAAANAVSNNIRVFAGEGSLEFQGMGVSAQQQAFIYIAMPTAAKPNMKVVAHLYTPSGAPPLLATIYVLDASYTWYSGPYLGLNAGNWTALAYQISAKAHAPIRQLGLMILGTAGATPYTGPLYLDSVDLQKP
jgi:hypothetical protein